MADGCQTREIFPFLVHALEHEIHKRELPSSNQMVLMLEALQSEQQHKAIFISRCEKSVQRTAGTNLVRARIPGIQPYVDVILGQFLVPACNIAPS